MSRWHGNTILDGNGYSLYGEILVNVQMWLAFFQNQGNGRQFKLHNPARTKLCCIALRKDPNTKQVNINIP